MTDADRPTPPLDPLAALRWGQRMADELIRLPDVIAQWREGVAIFVGVARRLEAVTVTAEQLLQQIDASGVPEQLERLNRLGRDLSREVAGTATAGEQVLDETRRNVAALTRLFTQPPPEAGQ
ncbi:MAG TPA: hypothetical protein VK875_02845 [Euzebyales bacterium]|nr:hypothetical protein [Euzebyales bacterium]